MRARWLLLLPLIVITSPLAASEGYLDSYMTFSIVDTSMRSVLSVAWLGTPDCGGQPCYFRTVGEHTIRASSDGHLAAGITYETSSYKYRGSLTGKGAPGMCYFNRGTATSLLYIGNEPATVLGHNSSIAGTSECVPSNQATCPDFTTSCDPSPIVISLNGAYRLSSVGEGVQFDIDADGVVEQVSWIADGESVAFLAFDRNGNGAIDDGSELFGDHTWLTTGVRAANGFEALAEFDDDHNGAIDASDAVWNDLRLWFDGDRNGMSTAAELVPVTATPMTAISTDHRLVGRRDAHGNEYRLQGQLSLGAASRPCYDVYLVARE